MNLQQLQRIEDVPQEKLSDMNIDNLPPQWKVVKLSSKELFAFENGLWTGKKEPFIDCAVIRNTNFSNDGSLNLSNVAVIPIEQRQLEKKRLIRGDIIIERSGGGPQQAVGRVVFFDLTEGNYCFSNFTTRLRVIDKAAVEPRYLHLYLLYFHYSGQTEKLQNRTTGIRNLAFEDYKNSLIPLPPYPQQCSIVHALQIAQEAIQTRRDELKLEQERKAALVEYLFTYGPISMEDAGQVPMQQTVFGLVPQHWDLKKCAEVCQTISVGIVVRPASYYVSSGVPAFRSLNVREDRLFTRDLVFVSNEANESVLAKSKLHTGDVLIVRTGEPGVSCIVPAEYDGSNCIDIIFARPNVTLMTSEFFSRFMNTSTAKRQAFKARTGIAQQHLNVGAVQRIEVPLPPLNEQQEIVNVLRACDAKVSALEQELVLLEELFHTLLEELMTGRLSTLPLIANGETHE